MIERSIISNGKAINVSEITKDDAPTLQFHSDHSIWENLEIIEPSLNADSNDRYALLRAKKTDRYFLLPLRLIGHLTPASQTALGWLAPGTIREWKSGNWTV